jgi:hypothetical protein
LDWLDELVNNSTSPACSPFLGETQYMDEWQANYHLCTSPNFKESLRTGEKGWLINVVPNPINHRRQCRRWVRRNKKQIKENAGGLEEKYQEALESLKADEEERERDLQKLADMKKVVEEGGMSEEDAKVISEQIEQLELELADDTYGGD